MMPENTERPKRRGRRKRNDFLSFAKLMLEKIGGKTLRRTDWEMLCQPCSYGYFRSTLQFLLKNSLVERLNVGVYKRTEKGAKQLELWRNNKDA